MNPPSRAESLFVVATPSRSVCDDNARALLRAQRLRFLALGTRRGVREVPGELTRLMPSFGLAAYIGTRILSSFRAEGFRARLFPWFDRWVKRQLRPGDHIISSFGYTNECFAWVRAHGGKTLVDAGNSHPENFWEILIEEHRRWNCPLPPVSPFWNRRSRQMMPHVDYVLCPSSFVRQSFLARGFRPEQIMRNIYPVDLSCFTPAAQDRPRSRPMTIISTGALSLRKGTPYMLEAFRLVHQKHPSARFLLTRNIHENVAAIVNRYSDLPIDWAPSLPHAELAARLRQADLFVLPSLEEGLVRTALEAMACGLPVILTPHTGANDFVEPGRNGEVVPIRDAAAIADAILKWAEQILAGQMPAARRVDAEQLSFSSFERDFIQQLGAAGLLEALGPSP